MSQERDPVERALGNSRDLYDVATWEPRSRFDRLAVRIRGVLARSRRPLVVVLAVLIFVVQLALTGFAVLVDPTLGALTLLSVVPAFLLAGYIWRSDVTARQPLVTLVVTFVLGMLFAGFAAIINTILQPVFEAIPVVGMGLFFYLVVGPLEETVKWSAVRFYAYENHIHAVIDGAIYGAIAGLGFATVENSLYITQGFMAAAQANTGILQATIDTAAVRSLAGPGHVIYTAISGYYLGLAKFNPENSGAIMVKGVLLAALIHATYDTLSTYLPDVIAFGPVMFVVFILVYDGIFGGFLLRKLARYRTMYREAMAQSPDVTAGSEPASD